MGALAIVEAPDECKGNKTKTRMNPDQGGFGDFYHQVPGILRKGCAALASAAPTPAQAADGGGSGGAGADRQPREDLRHAELRAAVAAERRRRLDAEAERDAAVGAVDRLLALQD